MISFSLSLDPKSKAILEKDKVAFREGMRKGLVDAMYFLEAEIKKSFGSGNTPKVRTGALRRSIKAKVSDLRGQVGSSLVYAAAQEFGAIIKARRSEYLTFKIGDMWVKKRSVELPARPYLYPTVEENVDKVGNIILSRIEQVLK
jgi:phage gpG-like protein